MVRMYHIVAHLQLIQLLQGQQHLALASLVSTLLYFMVTLENLMVGPGTYLQVMVHKTLMQSRIDRLEHMFQFLLRLAVEVHFYATKRVQNTAQSVCLFPVVRENIYRVTLRAFLLHFLEQQVEILVEDRLRRSVKLYLAHAREDALLCQLQRRPTRQLRRQLLVHVLERKVQIIPHHNSRVG